MTISTSQMTNGTCYNTIASTAVVCTNWLYLSEHKTGGSYENELWWTWSDLNGIVSPITEMQEEGLR